MEFYTSSLPNLGLCAELSRRENSVLVYPNVLIYPGGYKIDPGVRPFWIDQSLLTPY